MLPAVPESEPAMHVRTSTAQLKDEVYRQMFRLEEGRSGSELGLALALLRAWIATDSKLEGAGNRKWLSKVSPICLQMIATALNQNAPTLPSAP
jgi:hypothetical protein